MLPYNQHKQATVKRWRVSQAAYRGSFRGRYGAMQGTTENSRCRPTAAIVGELEKGNVR